MIAIQCCLTPVQTTLTTKTSPAITKPSTLTETNVSTAPATAVGIPKPVISTTTSAPTDLVSVAHGIDTKSSSFLSKGDQSSSTAPTSFNSPSTTTSRNEMNAISSGSSTNADMTRSDQISLGVGIGIGLPACL